MQVNRGEVLKAIQKIVVEFVKHVCKEVKKLPHNVVEAAGGKIFTYGSYRLGVYGPGNLKRFYGIGIVAEVQTRFRHRHSRCHSQIRTA